VEAAIKIIGLTAPTLPKTTDTAPLQTMLTTEATFHLLKSLTVNSSSNLEELMRIKMMITIIILIITIAAIAR